MGRIGLRQLVSDREARLIGGQGGRQIALRHLHVADLVTRQRQIALPAGIAGIGLRQLVSDREALPEGTKCRPNALRQAGNEAPLTVRQRPRSLRQRVKYLLLSTTTETHPADWRTVPWLPGTRCRRLLGLDKPAIRQRSAGPSG